MGRRLRLVVLACLLGASLSACRSESLPPGPVIISTEDLVKALRQAGAEVQPTALATLRAGLPGGQTFFVGKEQVEVFEFESEPARDRALENVLQDSASLPRLWAHGRLIVAYDGLDGATIALLSGLLGDLVLLPQDSVVEPYPPAVAAAIAWVSETKGIDPGSVGVLGYEHVDWPDACLGLARTDEMCATVITPGWKIVLQTDTEPVIVRTDELGAIVRAEP
jgi:hypothetical protein